MKKKITFWLPIIFGCHQQAERSLCVSGRKFPICSRCTGELIGMTVGIPIYFLYAPSFWWCLILLLPMLVDGFLQSFTRYESTNTKRILTGLLFGYGILTLFFSSLQWVLEFGMEIGKNWKNS